MKKPLIILFFWVFIISNTFAEDDENKIVSEQKTARNSVSDGINLSSYYFPIPIGPGLSIEYERLLGKIFSVGLEIGTMWFYRPYFEIMGRIYPFRGMFFGLSWGLWWPEPKDSYYFHLISAEFGWKIDLKKNKNWHLTPSIAGRLYGDPPDNDRKFSIEMILPVLNFKFGYKF